MKVHFQRLAALLMALIICLGLVAPASATPGDAVDEALGNIWDWLTLKPTRDLISAFLAPEKDPETATPEDWNNAYTSYVTNIQNNYSATIIDAGGNGLIPLTGWSFDPEHTNLNWAKNLVVDAYTSSFRAVGGDNYFSFPLVVPFSVPVLGEYDFVFPSVSYDFESTTYYDVDYCRPSGTALLVRSWNRKSLVTPTVVFYPDTSYQLVYYVSCDRVANKIFSSTTSGLFYLRAKKLFPSTDININSDSRAGTFSGNFGYYGDNGQLITGENVKIVNEGDKTIYNPATGTTSNVKDWNYDYSNRSYDLTLDTGDKITVTYGDENVTIKEGDTNYTIYYITQGGGSTDPSPSPTQPPATCKHQYTTAVTKEPTCTAVGTSTSTCTLCGDVKTEQIAATGHKWVEDQTVPPTTDDAGNQTAPGYTLYKCSVCGEEYKDTQGTGPPGEDEKPGFLEWLLGKLGELLGAIGNGVIVLIQNTLGKLLDGLIALVSMVVDKLGGFLDMLFGIFDEVPAMFTGFTEFLGKMFAFLPPEFTTIIIFGILAVVLVAIVKMFLK